ncbi:uncharacterized protein DEA37_0007941, partial [Paragonimus westermani]
MSAFTNNFLAELAEDSNPDSPYADISSVWVSAYDGVDRIRTQGGLIDLIVRGATLEIQPELFFGTLRTKVKRNENIVLITCLARNGLERANRHFIIQHITGDFLNKTDDLLSEFGLTVGGTIIPTFHGISRHGREIRSKLTVDRLRPDESPANRDGTKERRMAGDKAPDRRRRPPTNRTKVYTAYERRPGLCFPKLFALPPDTPATNGLNVGAPLSGCNLTRWPCENTKRVWPSGLGNHSTFVARFRTRYPIYNPESTLNNSNCSPIPYAEFVNTNGGDGEKLQREYTHSLAVACYSHFTGCVHQTFLHGPRASHLENKQATKDITIGSVVSLLLLLLLSLLAIIGIRRFVLHRNT